MHIEKNADPFTSIHEISLDPNASAIFTPGQGGGWVTVAPRDTCQQGNDSESAAVSRSWRKITTGPDG